MFSSARVAVFVDGCFWHGCPEHATRPAVNAWTEKLRRNRERDIETDALLEEAGWRSLCAGEEVYGRAHFMRLYPAAQGRTGRSRPGAMPPFVVALKRTPELEAPREFLRRSVELEFDPDDSPAGELVPSSEPPEVLTIAAGERWMAGRDPYARWFWRRSCD